MTAPNFELKTELQMNRRRDFYLAEPSLASPNSSTPLVDGEWLQLDSNYKLARGENAGSLAVYPVFSERGRYDVQAIGKVTVLMLDQYEAETTLVTMTGITDVGMELAVCTGTYAGLPGRRGLKLAEQGDVVVGYVTKLFSGQNKVRFVHTHNYVKA